MIPRSLRLPAAILLLSVAHTAASQVAQPSVHVGDSWTFRNLDGFTNETQSETLNRVVDVSDSEIVVQVHNLTKDKTGLRYFNHDWNPLDNDESKYDPYYPEYKFPMAAGQTWEQKYTALPKEGTPSTGFVTAKVYGPEKVDVPAGTFDAYRIERDQESRSNSDSATLTKLHLTTWYAPAVHRFVKREWTVMRDGRVRGKNATVLVAYSLAEPGAAPK